MDGLLINGEVYYVQSIDDFVHLVEDVMGLESAMWLEKYLENETVLKERLASISNGVHDIYEQISDLDSECYEYE